MAFNKKWALITLTILSVYVFFYIHDYSTNSFLALRGRPIKQAYLLNYGKTVVLFWTPFSLINWMENGWNLNATYYFSDDNCIFTFDRDYLNVAKAVVFHWRDTDFHDLPDVHYLNQSWVLFNSESAANNVLYRYDKMLKRLERFIDLTMSHRKDSDIYAPYGGYVKRDSSSEIHLPNISIKDGSVAWMASNCETPGKREIYVSELSKYLKLDIMGKCGKVTCWPRDAHQCMEALGKNYTFYLSFENSLCKDYVTEKAFRALKYDLIPIVLGGADYASILPPNSFIDALSFSSPFHLAQYLNKVKINRTLLASYYEWKKDYKVISSLRSHFFSSLCKTFSNGQIPPVKKRDFYRFWIDEDNCTSLESNRRTVQT